MDRRRTLAPLLAALACRAAPPAAEASAPATAAPEPPAPSSPRARADTPTAAPEAAAAPANDAAPATVAATPTSPPPDSCPATPAPGSLAIARVVALGDRLYFPGAPGPDGGMLRYDPGEDRWVRLPGPTIHGVPVAVSGRIVVVGGASAMKTAGKGRTELFDPATCTWTAGPELPWNATTAAVTAADDRVFVAGGTVDVGADAEQTLRKVVAFRVGDARTTALPAMRHPRSRTGLAAVGGRLYAFGGHEDRPDSGTGVATSTAEALDLARGRWNELEPLPASLHSAHAQVLADGRIMILGDAYLTSIKPREMQLYDPAAGTYTPGSPPPTEASVVGVTRLGDEVAILMYHLETRRAPKAQHTLAVTRYRPGEAWTLVARRVW